MDGRSGGTNRLRINRVRIDHWGGYTPYPLGGLQHNVLLIGLQLLFRKFLEMFFEAVQGESHRGSKSASAGRR